MAPVHGDVGGRHVVQVGPAPATTTACRVGLPRVDALLRAPARSLTLSQAAQVVAHLHEVGDIRLRVPPRFSADCRTLVAPGPSAEHAGRFVVSLEGGVRAGGHQVQFVYLAGHTTPPPPSRRRGYRFLARGIDHVDVRLVVLLHHLVTRLVAGPYDGKRVVAIAHMGFNGKAHDRALRGGLDRSTHPPTPYSVYRLHDAHWSGRALDFGGVLLGPPGSAPITEWIDRSAPNEQAVVVKDHWGSVGAPGARGFRLAGDLARTGTPAGERARLLHDCLDVFAKHSSTGEMYTAADTGLEPYLAAPRGGWLIHPDYQDPGTRAAHQDHIHAQIGPLNYEFPDDASRRADLASAQQPHERGTRAHQHAEQGGVAVARRGAAPASAADPAP